MTPTTLQALRRLLFFSVPEAAEHIGGVSERYWRFWETGARPIPADVIETVRRMVAWRTQALTTAEKALANEIKFTAGRAGGTVADARKTVIWYTSAAAYAHAHGDPAYWRPHCSVVAELCARHGAEAVPSG